MCGNQKNKQMKQNNEAPFLEPIDEQLERAIDQELDQEDID